MDGVSGKRDIQNHLLFEVATEIANRGTTNTNIRIRTLLTCSLVGGIYSVLKSKAPVTTLEYGDRYTLLGPLNKASVCPSKTIVRECKLTTTGCGRGRRARTPRRSSERYHQIHARKRCGDHVRAMAYRRCSTGAPHEHRHGVQVDRRVEGRPLDTSRHSFTRQRQRNE